MPISEDEYDPCTTYEASSTMSKAELRKTHKPIMEKKRRARINHCLNEIKTLILDALKKDPARHSKLEKADILEMAVKHLQNVQRQQLALAMASDPSVLRKFKAGFNECAEEVKRYVGGLEGLEAGVQQRISSHLSKCISGIEQIVHLNFPGFGGIPFLTSASSILTSKLSETAESSDDQNNNPSIQIPHSLQVIPSRLPTGELALLLPNSNSLPYFSSVAQNNQFNQNSSLQENKRLSAFVTVIPSSVTSTISSPNKTRARPPSPPQSPSSSSILRPEQEQMISVPQIRKTPSPHGFRPVHPNQYSRIQISSLYKHPANNLHLDPQQIVTSTSSTDCDVRSIPKTTIQSEVKSICFPIQKLSEPLSIITNQSERYKFAQTPEESIKYEENIQRGVKRKFECVQPGLITVLPQKVLKTCHDSSVVDFKIIDDNQRYNELFLKNVQLPSTSQGREEHPESNADMWRPW